MLVSNNGTDERMDSKASLALWEAFDRLPQEKRAVVSADEVAEKMQRLQEVFHLDDKVIGQVTLLVRRIFFGELQMAECEAKIGSLLATTAGGDPNQAKAIVTFIQKEILTIQPKPQAEEAEEDVRPAGVMANLPVLQALSKYEKLGNQLITEARIRVKSQPEPVRPSLLYWLKYYRDELGVGHHDSVQRGQFLFRSENGKKLSAGEREHVSLILKSVEENFPIAVDTERQEIVFPVFHGVMIGTHAEPAAVPSNAKIIRGPEFSAAPATGQYVSGGLRIGRGTHFGNLQPAKEVAPGLGEVSFSTKHVFAAEKEDAEQEKLAAQPTPQPAQSSAAPQPAAPRPAARSVAPKMNPFRIHPVSLGKKIGGTAKNVV